MVGDVAADAGLEGVVVGGGTFLDGLRGGDEPGAGAGEVFGGEDAVEGGGGEDEVGVAGVPGGDGGAFLDGATAPEVDERAGEGFQGGVGGELFGIGVDVGVAEDKGRGGARYVAEGFGDGVGGDEMEGDGALGLVARGFAEIGLEMDVVHEEGGSVGEVEGGGEGAAGGAAGAFEGVETDLPDARRGQAGEEGKVELVAGAGRVAQVGDVGEIERAGEGGIEGEECAGVFDFLEDEDVGIGFGDGVGGAADVGGENFGGAFGAVASGVGEVFEVEGGDADAVGRGKGAGRRVGGGCGTELGDAHAGAGEGEEREQDGGERKGDGVEYAMGAGGGGMVHGEIYGRKGCGVPVEKRGKRPSFCLPAVGGAWHCAQLCIALEACSLQGERR